MRLALAVLAGLALASCDRLPWGGPEPAPEVAAPAVAPERVEAFVYAVERTGCTVDSVNHDALHRAGFSDIELSAIGDILVTDGRARLADAGLLILQTEDCI